MIDFDTARRKVIEKWLPAFEEDLNTPAILYDDETKEYEWGWMFFYGPLDPAAVPPDEVRYSRGRMIVDRVCGGTTTVGTAGLNMALASLAWGREAQ